MSVEGIQGLSPSKSGGSPQPIQTSTGNEATFTKTNTKRSYLTNVTGMFGGFFRGGLLSKAITFIVIFFVLKMTVFK